MAQERTPPAVVTACMGGAQGDLSMVRSLGRSGVSVALLAEYGDAPAGRSRYADRVEVCAGLTTDDAMALACLEKLGGSGAERPVLIPTADPDLLMMDRLRDRLSDHFRVLIPSPEVIAGCSDKARFAEWSQRLDLPTPATHVFCSPAEAEAFARDQGYPIIVKPSLPQDWASEEVSRIVNGKKALLAHNVDELRRLCDALAPHGGRLLLQEYVPGRDDRLFSLHIYVDRSGRPSAWFTGQKIRTYPTYAGIGCFVRSVVVPEIVELGKDVVSKIGYRGLGLLQFKQDERTGAFKLLEINPRTSSWNLLAAACGVNLPYAAYCDAVGLPLPPRADQREGVRYLYFEHDVKAFLDYRAHGDVTTGAWLRSLAGRNVYQHWAWDDQRPFWADARRLGGNVLRKVTRRAE